MRLIAKPDDMAEYETWDDQSWQSATLTSIHETSYLVDGLRKYLPIAVLLVQEKSFAGY